MAAVAQPAPIAKDAHHSDHDMTEASVLSSDHRHDADASASEKSPRKRHSDSDGKKAKKRRKVNHACVYCRRSHMTCDQNRPCSRCIKRSIGHLCHDEPREKDKKGGREQDGSQQDGADSSPQRDSADTIFAVPPTLSQPNAGFEISQDPLNQPLPAEAAQFAQPEPTRPPMMASSNQPLFGYDDWSMGVQGQAQDMYHPLHPNLMFNSTEASGEYNLLSDFVSNSLMEDGFYPAEGSQHMFSDPSLSNTMGTLGTPNPSFAQPNARALAAAGNAISRPASAFPNEKAREAYFLTAADPAGTDDPDTRMQKLLQAKYDAGMLKPFNYVRGYARLNQWMEKNLPRDFREKILHQLDRFRPLFRKSVQKLSDIELVVVEVEFERRLMEYDRIFASMAIPACCWRRTGEIFRANSEMAELINVPLDDFRDGKLAIWMIMAEDSLVSYWEKFTTIAFDTHQKAMLTSCKLKSQSTSAPQTIHCCFSFTIVRDTHNVPLLMVGNFLPKPARDK